MAVLLTWSPKSRDWDWSEMPRAFKRAFKTALTGQCYHDLWSVHRRKNIPIGTRVFLLRQGVEPKGIVGSGRTTSWPYAKRTSRKRFQAVDVRFDTLLDPNKYPPLDWRKFTDGPLADVHWNTQWSGIEVPDELYEPWKRHVTKVLGILPASLKDDEHDFEEIDFPEGRIYYRLHRQRERNSKLVQQAKARAKQKGRLYCWACSFDFAAVYGPYGEGFVEAHHTVPVHQLTENSKTKISDLAMVCCNCHRILHRHPSLTVEKLRRWLGKNR